MKEYTVYKEYNKELERDVHVYVMTPVTYNQSTDSYPVVYMFDGHNLFDDKTATFGTSWGLLDQRELLPEVIVVGIDCDEREDGQKRLDEYSPWINTDIKNIYKDSVKRDVGGKGDLYLEYVVSRVKPFIEQTYRVNNDSNVTSVMGSSMGGLLSTFAVFKYPSVFSRCGAVSNAYWFALDEIKQYIDKENASHIKKFYMDVGSKETSRSNQDKNYYVNTNKDVYDVLKCKLEGSKLRFEIIQGGKHNEDAWSKRVVSIMNYLYEDLRE